LSDQLLKGGTAVIGAGSHTNGHTPSGDGLNIARASCQAVGSAVEKVLDLFQ
jgi:hypothetical protein